MSNNTAIFDLDGTLADCIHRLHYIKNGNHNWDKFFEEMDKDPVIDEVLSVLVSLSNDNWNIIICTGRPEKYRNITEAWLNKYGIVPHKLYMRPDNDTRPDHIIKKELLQQIYKDGFNPIIVFDDRQSVVDMWRENGLKCLQCAPSDIIISNTTTLTLMIGPSGAGKSTFLQSKEAQEVYGIHPSHILSSDQIRQDMLGDFKNQSRNEDVFEIIHKLAKIRLQNNLPVVIDATHIKRKDRINSYKLSEGICKVRYIIINRNVEEKLGSAGWRKEVPGLIERHENTFQQNLKDILKGDGFKNVEIIDLRR